MIEIQQKALYFDIIAEFGLLTELEGKVLVLQIPLRIKDKQNIYQTKIVTGHDLEKVCETSLEWLRIYSWKSETERMDERLTNAAIAELIATGKMEIIL